MKVRFIKYPSVGIILLVLLGPYIYLCQYLHLYEDDFCRAHYPISAFLNNFLFWLQNENGRYINALITNLPVYNLYVYRLLPIIFLTLLLFSWYRFVTMLANNLNFQISRFQLLVITVFAVSHFIQFMPATAQFLYWFAGSTVYLLPFVALLELCSMFIVFQNKPTLNQGYIIFLIIFCCGSNEIATGVLGFLLFGHLLHCLYNKRVNLSQLLKYSLVYLVAIIPLLFLKGTQKRLDYYEDKSNLIQSMLNASKASIVTIYNELLQPEVVSLLFVIIAMSIFNRRINFKTFGSIKDLLKKIVFSISMYWCAFFVMYYATGAATFNLNRTGNFLQGLFLIFLIFNVLNFVSKITIEAKNQMVIYNLLFLLVSTSICIYFQVKSSNYKEALYEISSKKADKFDEMMQLRFKTLAESSNEDIYLEEIEIPKIIYTRDLYNDSEYWVNGCYRAMVERKYAIRVKSITLEY